MSKLKNKRKLWFRCYKTMMKIFIRRTKFVYLGEPVTQKSVIVSNHARTGAPLAWELYNDVPITFWGAHEMNSGLIKMYKYQTRVYYHEKKHWNLGLARIYCLLASPLTNIFYKGIKLISTYKDIRFRNTIKESVKALNENKNIIIFPEISDKGYLDQLEGFHEGVILLLEYCLKNNMDIPVYVSYYTKSKKQYIVDKPVMVSELFKNGETKAEVAKRLCDRCNELGRMEI